MCAGHRKSTVSLRHAVAPESRLSRGLRRVSVPCSPGLAPCRARPARSASTSESSLGRPASLAAPPLAGEGRRVGASGSRIERLQRLAATFGSQRSVANATVATVFPRDPDLQADRRDVCLRHRAVRGSQSVAEPVDPNSDDVGSDLGAAADECANGLAHTLRPSRAAGERFAPDKWSRGNRGVGHGIHSYSAIQKTVHHALRFGKKMPIRPRSGDSAEAVGVELSRAEHGDSSAAACQKHRRRKLPVRPMV